jgi:hypothetical protein
MACGGACSTLRAQFCMKVRPRKRKERCEVALPE